MLYKFNHLCLQLEIHTRKQPDYNPTDSLPDGTFVLGVHGGAERAAIGGGEVPGVGERADDADGAGGVHCGADLGEGILGAHGAAPDLSVVQEEQLIVREVDPGQSRLLAEL